MNIVYPVLFGLAICAVIMVVLAICVTPLLDRKQADRTQTEQNPVTHRDTDDSAT